MDEKINTGIYKIEHIESGKVYIGSAVNIKRRWQEHKFRLRTNIHPNSKLQNAWDKYGEEAFSFETLLSCESKDFVLYEQRAMDLYKVMEHGYNLCPAAGSALGIKRSEETKARMSAVQKGRVKTEEQKEKIRKSMLGKKRGPHSEESKANISVSLKGKLKGPQSEETKSKRSASLRDKTRAPFSEEHLKRLSESHKGKSPSEETRLKLSLAMKEVRARNKLK